MRTVTVLSTEEHGGNEDMGKPMACSGKMSQFRTHLGETGVEGLEGCGVFKRGHILEC